MTSDTPALLQPAQLGALTLPNRIVMAPLTRQRALGTIPNALMAQYYAQRASAGLIIGEGTQIDPMGVGFERTPGIHDAAQVAGWRGVTEAVHRAGGRILCQLWHVGRASHSLLLGGELPVAPSALRIEPHQIMTPEGKRPYEVPRELRRDEIPALVGSFAAAAERAREAGFDGVQLHGANGYLIDQFLCDGSNQRGDEYGGSARNRARFLREVAEAVAAVWGAERVAVRLSPRGSSNGVGTSNRIETYGAAIDALKPVGLAFVELYDMRDGHPRAPEGPRLAPVLARQYGGNVIVNGGYDRETGITAIESGEAHAVAFGKLFISNPDLPRRFALGAALNEWDVNTFYTAGPEGYVDYPALEQV